MVTVIDSRQVEYDTAGKFPQWFRLVTHRLDDGSLFTILYLPGGKDSGLRDEAARTRWAVLDGTPVRTEQAELF